MDNKLLEQIVEATHVYDWIKTNGLDLLWIVGGSLVAYYVGRIILDHFVSRAIVGTAKHRAWNRRDIEKRRQTLLGLIRTIWRILIIFHVVSTILTRFFGVDLSPLFASAGIIGVAIGFGSQSLVKDFLSGIFIIAENQYRVGDVVEIQGASGVVERIGTRSTVIRDVEGNVHYLPNGMVQHVMNKTMGFSMSRLTLKLAAGADIDKVTKIINKIGEKMAAEPAWKKKIIQPPAYDSIGDMSGNSVTIIVTSKTQPSDQWDVTNELRRRLLEAFVKNEIALAA